MFLLKRTPTLTMRKRKIIQASFLLLILFIQSQSFGKTIRPVLEYPILGSEYIGDSCEVRTNLIIVFIDFSNDGKVVNLEFIHESSIAEVNKEAEKILRSDSWSEIENMGEDEFNKHQKVTVRYLIPCSNQKIKEENH